jgi:hypothetical protein
MQFSGVTMTGGFNMFTGAAPVVPTDTYWANVSFLSETTSTNAQTNNVFLDSSSSPKTLTNTGTLAQGTFSPFTLASGSSYSPSVNGGSGLFSGGQLSFTQQTISGDFTAECWFYRTGNAAGYSIIFGGDASTGGAPNCQLSVRNDGSVWLLLADATIISNAGTAVTTNAWHHIAWVRSGSSCAIFVDGTRVGTGTSSANLIYQAISSMAGLGGITSNYYAQGYLSSCRVVSSAVYNPSSTTITVPTAPLTAISGTSLLCNFTNAGIYDAATKSDLISIGSAQASTTQAKWSPTSAYLPGAGSYLYAQPNTAFAFGTGDFTVECWVNMSSLTAAPSGTTVPFVQGDAIGSSTSDKWWMGYDGGNLYFACHAGGPYVRTAFTASTSTWYYVTATRSSGTMYLFVNGVSGSLTGTGNFSGYNLGQGGLSIGGFSTPAYMVGYIQDLRLTKGVARYTATFTPPTAALPTSA